MHSRKYGVNLGWWLVVYDIFTFNINHLGWFQMYFSIPTLTLTLLIKAIPHLTKTKLAQNIQKKFGLTDIVLLNITFMWIHLHKIFYYFEKFVIWCDLVLSPWLAVVSLQSCHIGEEDEGGEQEGEEPSFEVRQTEMVWGDQGKGDRGLSGEATPHALSDHTMTSHSAHPPTPPTLATTFLFFLFLSLLSFTHTTCLFRAMVDWPVHAFAGLCPPVGTMLRTQFVLFPQLHDLSAERWCS